MSLLVEQTLFASQYAFFTYDTIDNNIYVNPTQLDTINLPNVDFEKVFVRHIDELTIAAAMGPNDSTALPTLMQNKLITLLETLYHHDFIDTDNASQLATRNRVSSDLDVELEKMENKNMMESVEDMLSQNQHKYDFQEKKNKLITLLAKNNNIKDKYTRVWYTHYIFLAILIIFAIGVVAIYAKGSSAKTVLDNKPMYFYILIFTGLLTLMIITVINSYNLFNKKHYEFETFVAASALITKINDYLQKLPAYIDLHLFLEENLISEHHNRQRIVRSMNKEFDIMNYSFMRKFQLNHYAINRLRHNMKYIKYGFVVVALISLFGGLNIRTSVMLKNNNVNGLPMTSGVFKIFSVVLLLSYILVIALQERQNMSRRKYNWNKMYWLIKDNDENSFNQCNQ